MLRGRQKETVVKELRVSSAAASGTFRFKAPYKKAGHGSTEDGINWMEGLIENKELHTVINESVAVFVHLYA